MKEFKELKEKKEEKKVVVKKKFGKKQVMDYERAEIKKLNEGDAEIAHNIMKRCMFDVNIHEITDILKKGMSYGAFVGRMLIGVGLAWEVYYNHESKRIEDGVPNAIYLEDDALLLAYEGQGIREMLIDEREREGKFQGFEYAVVLLITGKENEEKIEEMIARRGTKTERVLHEMRYGFYKTEAGVLAVKKL